MYHLRHHSTDELIRTFEVFRHAKVYADNYAAANGGADCYITETKMVYTTRRLGDVADTLEKARGIRIGEFDAE